MTPPAASCVVGVATLAVAGLSAWCGYPWLAFFTVLALIGARFSIEWEAPDA